MAIAAVTSSSLTVGHRRVCDALRGVLRQATQAGPGAVEEIGSMPCRVSAVVHTLLLDHSIDRRGRCRSCRIHLKASYWLLCQPDDAILRSHLADDLGLTTVPGAGTPQPPTDSGGSLVITGSRS